MSSQPITGVYRLNPNLKIDTGHYNYNYHIQRQEETDHGLAVFIIPTTTVKTSKPATMGQCAKYCTWILKSNIHTLGD